MYTLWFAIILMATGDVTTGHIVQPFPSQAACEAEAPNAVQQLQQQLEQQQGFKPDELIIKTLCEERVEQPPTQRKGKSKGERL